MFAFRAELDERKDEWEDEEVDQRQLLERRGRSEIE